VPTGAVVIGSSGVGKTRLVEEAIGRDTAIWIVATESSRPIPFGAVAPWLPADGVDHEPAALLRLGQERLTRALGPRVDSTLVVDDAHLLDPMSATLVHRIAVEERERVVVTVRGGEPVPDAITSLWKDGPLERLELGPLDLSDVGRLLADALGGPVEEHTCRRLWSLAGGSLLFLRELTGGELASGSLARRDGIWHWSGSPTVPSTVIELVNGRLSALPSDHRAVCEYLSCIEPLDAAVLSVLTTEEAVEGAESRGLVATENGGSTLRVRLHHPIYGEALRRSLPAVRQRRLRSELLRTLEDTSNAGGRDDIVLLQRAVLRLDADALPEPDALLAGAAIATGLFDFALAARLAKAAADVGGGWPARFLVASADTRLGHVTEAESLLGELIESAPDTSSRAAAIALRACITTWVHGRAREGRDVLDRLHDEVDDAATIAFLDALAACFAFFDGDLRASVVLADGVLGSSTTMPDQSVAWASAAAGISNALMGDVTSALTHADRGIAAVGRLHDDRYVRLSLGNGELLALGLAGDLAEAERRAQSVEEFTQASPGGEISAAGLFFRGQVAWWAGDLGNAELHLRGALAELAAFDSAGWTEQTLVVLAQTLACRGDAAGARSSLDRLQGSSSHRYRVFEPFVALARAWTLMAEGAVHDAFVAVHEAAATARVLDEPAVEVLAVHTAVRWGHTDVRRRLNDLVAVVDGPRAELSAAHAEALARHDGAGLVAVARRWQRLGTRLLAADAAAQAATLWRDAGDLTAATAASALATRFAEGSGAHTPALEAMTFETPLTPRERQIATLAASGLSSAQIGERLVISRRTVEGHLGRAYDKLGIHRRGDLAAALGMADD